MNQILEFLETRLVNQYGEELANKIVEGYKVKRKTTLRVNTLKSTFQDVLKIFDQEGITYSSVDFFQDALICENKNEYDLSKLSLFENGEIYLQSLSSMIPPFCLDVDASSHILDMCAAPGSKTTLLASLTDNKACITACEMNPLRAEKLKYNIAKQGCKKVTVLVNDARRLDEFFSFEKILLDAPCSGSGTLSLEDNKVFTYFNEKLILKSCKTQKELLKKGFAHLKKGGTLIYSTCSILQEENEDVVLEALKGKNYVIENIDIKDRYLHTLPCKIKGALLVMPNEYYEGFFICKIKKC